MTDKLKKKPMKARGIRFSDEQWTHLKRKAGKNGHPSDYNRELVDKDIAAEKRKK